MKYIESIIDTAYNESVKVLKGSIDAQMGILGELSIPLDAFFESIVKNAEKDTQHDQQPEK